MRPTLFQIGWGAHTFAVHAYGFLIALGLVAGVALAVRRARPAGIDTATVLDFCFYAIVAGMVGSRLLYVLVHLRPYVRLCLHGGGQRGIRQWLYDCSAPFQFWQGGLVFLGGALLAAGTTLLYARRKGLAPGLVADVLAPSVSLAHVFGRLGCFMVGCCYGKPTPGGVHFPPDSVAYTELLARGELLTGSAATQGLHPTQLYEAAGELLIFLGLLRLARRPHAQGSIALAYGFAYGMVRLAIEVLRGDEARGFLFQVRLPALARLLAVGTGEPLFLSSAQASAIALMAVTAIGYAVLRRRARTTPSS